MAQGKEPLLPMEKVFGCEDSVSLQDAGSKHHHVSTKGTFKIDSAISCKFSNGRDNEEAELMPWDGGDCEDEGFDLLANSEVNGWDPTEMFLKNKVDYGVRSSFQPSLEGYTVQLQKEDTPEYRNAEQKATEVAKEILSNPRRRSQVELVNGEDEEECHAAVVRTQKPAYVHGVSKYPPSSKTKTFRPTPPSTPPESLLRTTSPGGRGYSSRGYHHATPPSTQGPGSRGYFPRHYYHPNHHAQGAYETASGTPPLPAGRVYGPRPCNYHNTQPPPPTASHMVQRSRAGPAPVQPPPPPLPQREPRVNGLERRRHHPVAEARASPAKEERVCVTPAEEQGVGVGDAQDAEASQPAEHTGKDCRHNATTPPLPQSQYQQLARPHVGQLRPYRSLRSAWRPQVPRFTSQPQLYLPPQHNVFPLPSPTCSSIQVPVQLQVSLNAAGTDAPTLLPDQDAKKHTEMEEMKNFSEEFNLMVVEEDVQKEPAPAESPAAADPMQDVAAVANNLCKSTLNPNAKEFVYNPEPKPPANVANNCRPPSTPTPTSTSPGQRTPQYTPSPGLAPPLMPATATAYMTGPRDQMFAYHNSSRQHPNNRFRRYQGPGVALRPSALPVSAVHVAGPGAQPLLSVPSALQLPFTLPYAPQQIISAQPYHQLVSVVAEHGRATSMLPLQSAATMGYFSELQQAAAQPPPQLLCALPQHQHQQAAQPPRHQQPAPPPPPPQQYHHEGQPPPPPPPPPPAMVPWIRPMLPPAVQQHLYHHHHHHHHHPHHHQQ